MTVPIKASDSAFDVILTATIGDQVKLSLMTDRRDIAEEREAAVRLALSRMIAASSCVIDLTFKQQIALSGDVYNLFIERHSENPGAIETWEAVKAFNRAATEGRVRDSPELRIGRLNQRAEAVAEFGDDLTGGINARESGSYPAPLEARFGSLLDFVLTSHGIDVTLPTRANLLIEVARASQDAAWQLKRNAGGDYRPDPNAGRFPAFQRRNVIKLDELFRRWRLERRPAAATIQNWSGSLKAFKMQIGDRDIQDITKADITAFKDALVRNEKAAKSINDTDLASLRALFGWAVDNDLMVHNPAKGVKVLSRVRAGDGRLPYTDSEVARLLTLAQGAARPAQRWLPLLAAMTGARVGELAQLWGRRVITVEGVDAIRIAPAEDGGSLKNAGSERIVPLHPAVIEAGFLDFVALQTDGPLFYRRTSGREGARLASKGVTNRLSTWIREAGFSDPRKAPMHALRHWFKSAAVRAGVSDSIADHLQGHAGKGDAAVYRHFELPNLAREIARIPIPTETDL